MWLICCKLVLEYHKKKVFEYKSLHQFVSHNVSPHSTSTSSIKYIARDYFKTFFTIYI